jgi:glycosyltransferase involved in cell wall biosynthesis
MTIPVVTVVMPAFNSAQVIKDSLDSIQAQTFRDFEVIVVDDGSTDNTAQIVRNFCKADARFTLIQQPNSGISRARNAAIRQARGEWIAFLDSDDLWLPEKLSRQMELSVKDPHANLLFTNYYPWDGKNDLREGYSPEKSLPQGDVMEELIWRFVFLPSSVLVRRQLLLEAGLFDVELFLSEDWDLWLRLGTLGLKVRGVREPLVRYRRWPESHTAKNKLKSIQANLVVLKKNFDAICAKYPALKKSYLKSLEATQTVCEIMIARDAVDSDPSALPALAWRAWRREKRGKWLRWYFLLRWPLWLGGSPIRNGIHEKIRKRWPPQIEPL